MECASVTLQLPNGEASPMAPALLTLDTMFAVYPQCTRITSLVAQMWAAQWAPPSTVALVSPPQQVPAQSSCASGGVQSPA